MAPNIDGMRIAFVVANEGVEQSELREPWQGVHQAGGRPQLVSPEPGEVQAVHHLEMGETFPVDFTTEEVDALSLDALVLPGGVANPDRLRQDEAAVGLVKEMFVCHGPWTLVEADLVRGRTLTSWPSLRTDITNAGGNWVDEQVQVDDNGPNAL